MNIDGLGDSLVNQLVDRGLVRSVADLYKLTADQLMTLERMGRKSAERVIQNVQASKNQPLPRLLNGLGIPFVGERTAAILAGTFGDLHRIANADEQSLQRAQEVGPKVAHSIVTFFAEPANRDLIEKLAEAGLKFTHEMTQQDGPLQGKTFVLTGTLPNWSRDEAKEQIEAAGGEV